MFVNCNKHFKKFLLLFKKFQNVCCSVLTDRGAWGKFLLPGKLNVKTGPLYSLYVNFSIFVFGKLSLSGVFLPVSEMRTGHWQRHPFQRP